MLLLLLLLLLGSLTVRTFRRNAVWLDEEALYRSGISVNPAKGLSPSIAVFVRLSRNVMKYKLKICVLFYRLY